MDICFQSASRMQFWPSRNGGGQMLFLTPGRNMFAGKLLVNSERFLAVLQEHIILNVKLVEVYKISEVFWAKLYFVKWVIFFGSFCGLWDFLLNNLKLKKDLIISTGTCGWVRKSYMPEKIFSKKCFYSLFQFSFLGGLIFQPRPAMAANIFTLIFCLWD